MEEEAGSWLQVRPVVTKIKEAVGSPGGDTEEKATADHGPRGSGSLDALEGRVDHLSHKHPGGPIGLG